ncbi:MAG: hypothetical protein LBS41_02650 [Streptococcaceae bacterium]|jgi:hypothetical protein|nr:hypothetical protein [Streptococcaceae bacterium]
MVLKKNHPLKTLPRLILAFVSSVFLCLFILLLSFRLTLFSEGHMKAVEQKTGFTKALTAEIETDISHYSLGSNVPKDVLEGVVTYDMVKKDVDNYNHTIYTPGLTFKISGQKPLETSIRTKITDYAKSKNQPVDDEAIRKLAQSDGVLYQKTVALPLLVDFGQRIFNYQPFLNITIVIALIAFLLVAGILYWSVRGYVHRLFRFSSFAMIAAGLMAIILPAFLLIRADYDRVAINSQAIYNFVTAYIASFLWMFVTIGGIMVVIGIVLAVLSERKRQLLMS